MSVQDPPDEPSDTADGQENNRDNGGKPASTSRFEARRDPAGWRSAATQGLDRIQLETDLPLILGARGGINEVRETYQWAREQREESERRKRERVEDHRAYKRSAVGYAIGVAIGTVATIVGFTWRTLESWIMSHTGGGK